MSLPTASFDYGLDSDADELQAIAAEQRFELMTAKTVDADLDFAFDLQLQEAITASLSLNPQPSTSSTAAAVDQPQRNEEELKFTDLLSDELLKLEQELRDQAISEREFQNLKNDLDRRLHDHQLALEISRMSDDEWDDWGDDFERPFGEGSSKGGSNEIFRVYFKGLMENRLTDESPLGGIGVAICDSRDDLLFELRKPFVAHGANRRTADITALIEGLNAALELQLQRLVFYCDYNPIFNYVTRQWSSKQKKVAALVDRVTDLSKKFTYCQPARVARKDIKFAFKLAREAIDAQVNRAAEASSSNNPKEACVICLEDSNINQIFSIDDCLHRYCFSCMKQHVEMKLLHGLLPTCPHEGCKSELKIDSCRTFLTPRLIDIMSQRMKEASIPVTEKVYCPYPKCSALMSKSEALEHSKPAIVGAERSGARKCLKCNNHFCINCKVPWHNNSTCTQYKLCNPHPPQEEAKLKNLAATNLWRQCVKCNYMIELATGCYHMTCRCGNEFCYTCGAEWKKKKATCSCPLWDEENILEDDFDSDEEDEDAYLDSDSDSDGY
ncbi:E3 ubiquitin-protein ligase RSL1-like [Salvia hispanica]|uniref:E3 ubiquitin-protein ligase RSL1-like n=1 Tax=Salvia hispanica TaxID=49212 RepID=UPI002009BEAF|nr:E3 ubiquitin-protein ligase RSL1-like [Salvia hispanica]